MNRLEKLLDRVSWFVEILSGQDPALSPVIKPVTCHEVALNSTREIGEELPEKISPTLTEVTFRPTGLSDATFPVQGVKCGWAMAPKDTTDYKRSARGDGGWKVRVDIVSTNTRYQANAYSVVADARAGSFVGAGTAAKIGLYRPQSPFPVESNTEDGEFTSFAFPCEFAAGDQQLTYTEDLKAVAIGAFTEWRIPRWAREVFLQIPADMQFVQRTEGGEDATSTVLLVAGTCCWIPIAGPASTIHLQQMGGPPALDVTPIFNLRV